MRSVGIREMRGDLAALVRAASAGEEITVRVNGRPTAVLGPARTAPAGTIDDLIRSGALLAPRRSDRTPAAGAVTLWAAPRLDRALRDVRG